MSSPAAILIAAAELAAAALLAIPETRLAGAGVAAALFLTYASVIAINLARRRIHMDCGCVSAARRSSIGGWMVWRNVVLATAVLAAALPSAARELSLLDLITIGSCVATLALLYAAFDQLGATPAKAGTAS
jgi:hypothetical protein